MSEQIPGCLGVLTQNSHLRAYVTATIIKNAVIEASKVKWKIAPKVLLVSNPHHNIMIMQHTLWCSLST